MKKRGFAMLLAVVLCVGSVSASALAKAEDRAETKAAEGGIPEAEAEVDEEPSPEEEPALETEPVPETEEEPGTESEPGTEAEPETGTDPEPGAEAAPATETETGPETVAEPQPAAVDDIQSLPEKKSTSGILPRMEGTGEHPFPTQRESQLAVTWKNTSLNQTVYSWKSGRTSNDDQKTIDGLVTGDYQVYVSFRGVGYPILFRDGTTYTLQLDWPSGDGVTVRVKGGNSGTVYQEEDKKTVLFTWEVSETGLLSVTIENRMDSFDGNVEFTASVRKDNEAFPDGDPTPAEVSIVKDGRIDEAIEDVITWKVTAVIPRCGDGQSGGEVCAWSLYDEIGQSLTAYGEVENDLSAIQVAMTSAEYPAGMIIPSVEKAGEEDIFAYRLEDGGSKKATLHFLNRCTCEEGHCAEWSDGCGCRYNGTDFCSCWQYIYNATVTFTYTTDISKLLQEEVDKNMTMSIDISNTVVLNRNSLPAATDSDTEYVRRPFVKKETGKPDDRDGIGQYEITFDPHEEDYSWADSITIQDEMDNLTLLADSLTVKAGDTALTRICEAKAFDLDPENDRDGYYSLSRKDVTGRDGKKTGENVTITVWYPTDQVCTVSYEAAVLSYAEEMEGTYSNTVRIGSVQSSVTGSYREGHSGESGSGRSYSMTLKKVDADDQELTLPGAVFEIYRYAVEDGYEKDWLLAVETTGEDGTFTFRSDLSKDILLEEDVLYYLREIKAPEGYQRTDTVYGFIFEVNGYTGSLPDGLEADHVTIGSSGEGGAIHIAMTETNQKETKITRAVKGVKTWEDQENTGSTRPESITVHLQADGEEADSRIITAEDDWAWSFTGLNFYAEDGHAICYTITEDPVEGYETLYHEEDYGITNRRTSPEKGVDTRGDGVYENDGEGVRPGDTVTYQIRFYNYRDGEADVLITDPLDDALDFVSASEDGIYEEETHTVTWTIKSVPARAWGEVTFTAVVNERAVQEGEVKNTALVQIGSDQAFETNTVRNPVPEIPEEQGKAPEAPGKGGAGVKTGDPGHIGLWLALMAAGIAVALAALVRRRKTDR